MAEKRYITQVGMGVDLHGQDVTQAACRAVRNAIANNCLCGISQVLDTDRPEEKMHVRVEVACPRPNDLLKDSVLAVIPFGKKTIEVKEGGMVSNGILSPRLGDKTAEIIIANAAVTVSVDSV